MKKLILSLFVCIIGLISFGYCGFISSYGQIGYYLNGYQIPPNSSVTMGSSLGDFFCIGVLGGTNCTDMTISYGDESITGDPSVGIMCIDKLEEGNHPIIINNSSNQYCPFLFFRGYREEIFPNYTKGECQVKYNLIPIEHVDQHYCETNDLCPEQNECTGTGGISELFINNISHIGAPLINITIPEEFNWDYTGNEEEFNLSVEGYNVDTEYIDGIIRTQNYKPTSEDFTQLVGILAPYSKYLLFLLFIFIIWAWIKKPFKSKKL